MKLTNISSEIQFHYSQVIQELLKDNECYIFCSPGGGEGGGLWPCPNNLEHFFHQQIYLGTFHKRGGGVVGLPKLKHLDF